MASPEKTSRPLKIGLTGGIGSGKSAAADLFAARGVPLVDADQVARDLVAPGEPALVHIADHFGGELLRPDGTLDRPRLRQIIFQDHQAKTWLEGLLHPLIRQRIEQALDAASAPWVLLVSPLLLESGQDSLVEQVLVVDVDEATQLARASARDGVEPEQIRRIIASQMPRAERLARADAVLDNSGDLAALERQVERLYRQFQAQAAGN